MAPPSVEVWRARRKSRNMAASGVRSFGPFASYVHLVATGDVSIDMSSACVSVMSFSVGYKSCTLVLGKPGLGTQEVCYETS